MRRFLYDTAVFVYAFGRDDPYREPCLEIVAAAGRDELQREASVDLLQELSHQRVRRTGDRVLAVKQTRAAASLCRIHDLTQGDALEALRLLERHPRLTARDSVFAAVALARDIDAILSPDRAFEEIAGLERIDPADEATVASLAA